MAVAERPMGFSLWVSGLLPSPSAGWSLLDSGNDRTALERQAKSMATILERRRLVVCDGLAPPPWKPML
jgi:hypothetical protein